MQRAIQCLAPMSLFLFLMMPLPHAAPASAQEIVWKPIQGGLLYTQVQTEDLMVGKPCTVHVYSIDTSRFRLRLFDCLGLADGKPLPLARWYELTDALLLFNVCGEAETGGSSPYLRISGRTVRSRLREAWNGLFVSDASGKSRPSTRVIDLKLTPMAPLELPYSDIYQQPMLLDERGEIRVNPRPYEATRVALGEDRQRNLLLFLTEEPCRLWDLARWLKECPFSLQRAMNLGKGNALQVLGRHPADRVYILEPTRGERPPQDSGSLLEDAVTKEALCCVMGVVALEQEWGSNHHLGKWKTSYFSKRPTISRFSSSSLLRSEKPSSSRLRMPSLRWHSLQAQPLPSISP
jgi:hypothetical protein